MVENHSGWARVLEACDLGEPLVELARWELVGDLDPFPLREPAEDRVVLRGRALVLLLRLVGVGEVLREDLLHGFPDEVLRHRDRALLLSLVDQLDLPADRSDSVLEIADADRLAPLSRPDGAPLGVADQILH